MSITPQAASSLSRRQGAADRRLRQLRGEGSPNTLMPSPQDAPVPANASIDCGWGRLLFGQTFTEAEALIESMRTEGPGRRDIAFYIRDPHVLLAGAPQELFLDPSHTYRLYLSNYRGSKRRPRGFLIRRLASELDAEAVNRIYSSRNMVAVRPDFFWSKRDARAITYLVAEDELTGEIIGTVTGVDHHRAFGDPERGTSLWCLAVDPQARQAGIGEALVRRLAETFHGRGAGYLDLSVLHDNEQAIALYEKLGFRRVALFAVKRKNPINERLFAGPAVGGALNPYARIIIDEARRRGIGIEIVDEEGGLFRLSFGGRSVTCRESLSELTTSIAMSICDDKAVTRRVVARAGVKVPAVIEAGDRDALAAFLAEHGSVVVKPARGEQGRGIAVGITDMEHLDAAIGRAREVCDRVLVEACAVGDDLRLIVIDYRLVAAAVRKPATVVGDGQSSIRALIERQSRRREAATGGESSIPLDAETERVVAAAGHTLEDVLETGHELRVRKTANLHTGGTIHDVTDHVHPALVDAAVRAARAIGIPVTGIDFMVPDHRKGDYVFIEANERPGLANHEPQPTAERFVDLLFPLSMPAAARTAAEHSAGQAAGLPA